MCNYHHLNRTVTLNDDTLTQRVKKTNNELPFFFLLLFAGVNGFGSEQVTFEIVIVGRSKSFRLLVVSVYLCLNLEGGWRSFSFVVALLERKTKK